MQHWPSVSTVPEDNVSVEEIRCFEKDPRHSVSSGTHPHRRHHRSPTNERMPAYSYATSMRISCNWWVYKSTVVNRKYSITELKSIRLELDLKLINGRSLDKERIPRHEEQRLTEQELLQSGEERQQGVRRQQVLRQRGRRNRTTRSEKTKRRFETQRYRRQKK